MAEKKPEKFEEKKNGFFYFFLSTKDRKSLQNFQTKFY